MKIIRKKTPWPELFYNVDIEIIFMAVIHCCANWTLSNVAIFKLLNFWEHAYIAAIPSSLKTSLDICLPQKSENISTFFWISWCVSKWGSIRGFFVTEYERFSQGQRLFSDPVPLSWNKSNFFEDDVWESAFTARDIRLSSQRFDLPWRMRFHKRPVNSASVANDSADTRAANQNGCMVAFLSPTAVPLFPCFFPFLWPDLTSCKCFWYFSSPTGKCHMLSNKHICAFWPHLWSSGQSSWLQIQRSQVRFPALPYFLKGLQFGTGSTQPLEDNWGATSWQVAAPV
jgi:hypothetical protein